MAGCEKWVTYFETLPKPSSRAGRSLADSFSEPDDGPAQAGTVQGSTIRGRAGRAVQRNASAQKECDGDPTAAIENT